MGKFDNLIKFLGNEDSYNPEQIESALETMGEATSDIDNLGNLDELDELSAESLANIDDLLGIIDDGSPATQETTEESSTSLDMDQLGEIPVDEQDKPVESEEMPPVGDDSGLGGMEQENGDTGDLLDDLMGTIDDEVLPTGVEVEEDAGTSLDTEQLDAIPVDEEEQATGFDDVLDDLPAGEGGEDISAELLADIPGATEETIEQPTPPIEEVSAIEETSTAEDVSFMTETKELDESIVGLDPEIIEELKGLDTAPPLKESIYETETSGGAEDLVHAALEEAKEMTSEESEFEIEQSTPVDEFAMPGVDTPISEGGTQDDLDEIGDLLSNLSPTPEDNEPISMETTPTETDVLGDDTSGLDDLNDLLGNEIDLGTTPAGGEDLSGGKEEDLSALMEDAGGDEISLESTDEGSEGFGLDIPLESGGDTNLPDLELPSEMEAEEGEVDLTKFDDLSFGGETSGGGELDGLDDLGLDTIADEAFGTEEAPSFDDETPSLDVPDDSAIVSAGLSVSPKHTYSAPEVDMDDEKSLKVRKGINNIIDPELRKKVRRCFLEDILKPDELEQLIAMFLLHQSEDTIQVFINDNFPKEEKISDYEEEIEKPTTVHPRRVIYAEDARRAQEFQKEFQNFSKYATIIVVVVILLGVAFAFLVWRPTRAKTQYEKGITAIMNTKYNKAEAYFQAGKQIGGVNLRWDNKYALSYFSNNQNNRGLKKLKDALDIKANDQETIFNLMDYYTIHSDIPKYEEAMKYLNRLDKRHRNDYEIVNKVGKFYMNWAEYTVNIDERAKLFTEASRIYENFATDKKNRKHLPSRFQLLSIALKSNNPNAIELVYTDIDTINKRAINMKTFTELGKFYVDNRELDKAKGVYKKLIDYLTSKTKYNKKKKKIEIAVKNTEVRFDFAEAYYEYARYLTVNMDFLSATTAATNAILLNDKNAKAFNLLGEIAYITETIPRHKDIAKSYFEKAIEVSKDYYRPYANLGHIYFYDNLSFIDPEQALNKALKNYKIARQIQIKNKEKKDFLLQYNLSWLYNRNGNRTDAFDELYSLYTDNPQNPVLSYAIGNTYFHLSDSYNYDVSKLELAKVQYDKAIDYYKKLADNVAYINPELSRHKEIYTQLARSYNNRGVIYSLLAEIRGADRAKNQQKALVDFYSSKDYAQKIEMIYSHSEYNIKYIINNRMKGREPSFDNDIPKRTTLQKLIEEFKQNLIETL